MIQIWEFYSYLSLRGDSEVAVWYRSQSDKVKAAFDTRLKTLAQLAQWNEPLATKLEDGEGLIEIRYKAADVQQRPIGFYGPPRRRFTILICAKEINGRFVPKDAIAIAKSR